MTLHSWALPLAVVALLISLPCSALGPTGKFVHIATGIAPLDTQIGYAERRMEKVVTDYEQRGYQAVDQRFHGALSTGEHWVAAPDVKIRQTLADVRIPSTGKPLPSQLYDTRMRFHYRSSAAKIATVGVYYELGQATDLLFKSVDDGVYSVTAYIGSGPEPRSAFLTFVTFANDRPVLNNIPIPGFSWGTRLSPRWGISLGFPYTGIWAYPFDWLKFDFSAEPLLHFDARLTVMAADIVDIYFEGISDQEVYKRSGRPSKPEQMVYTGQTYSLGLSKKAGPLLLELSGGMGLNRNYVETSDYLEHRKDGLLRIANGFVGQLRAEARF